MLKEKKILIGVSASIAIYKICNLVRLLKKEKAIVKVIMTEKAKKLICPAIFETLTSYPVYTFEFETCQKVLHIDLAEWADIFIIAPATANTISKLAHGIGDNLLTLVFLALPNQTPVIIAPAMNEKMLENIFVRENIERLKKRKNLKILESPTGILACGTKGKGKMVEPEFILEKIKEVFSHNEKN